MITGKLMLSNILLFKVQVKKKNKTYNEFKSRNMK